MFQGMSTGDGRFLLRDAGIATTGDGVGEDVVSDRCNVSDDYYTVAFVQTANADDPLTLQRGGRRTRALSQPAPINRARHSILMASR